MRRYGGICSFLYLAPCMWVDGKLSSSVVPDNILLSRDVERSKNGVGWGGESEF